MGLAKIKNNIDNLAKLYNVANQCYFKKTGVDSYGDPFTMYIDIKSCCRTLNT